MLSKYKKIQKIKKKKIKYNNNNCELKSRIKSLYHLINMGASQDLDASTVLSTMMANNVETNANCNSLVANINSNLVDISGNNNQMYLEGGMNMSNTMKVDSDTYCDLTSYLDLMSTVTDTADITQQISSAIDQTGLIAAFENPTTDIDASVSNFISNINSTDSSNSCRNVLNNYESNILSISGDGNLIEGRELNFDNTTDAQNISKCQIQMENDLQAILDAAYTASTDVDMSTTLSGLDWTGIMMASLGIGAAAMMMGLTYKMFTSPGSSKNGSRFSKIIIILILSCVLLIAGVYGANTWIGDHWYSKWMVPSCRKDDEEEDGYCAAVEFWKYDIGHKIWAIVNLSFIAILIIYMFVHFHRKKKYLPTEGALEN